MQPKGQVMEPRAVQLLPKYLKSSKAFGIFDLTFTSLPGENKSQFTKLSHCFQQVEMVRFNHTTIRFLGNSSPCAVLMQVLRPN